MNKKEIAKWEARKKAARERAIALEEEKRNSKKRNNYDRQELKQRWLQFDRPTTRSKEDARILKEKYYKDHPITISAIYSQIYRWTKENALALGVEVTVDKKETKKKPNEQPDLFE